MQFVKLDAEVIDLLRCPVCKGALEAAGRAFVCDDCAVEYPQRAVGDEHIYDFRLRRPDYCVPDGMARWAQIQKIYENYHDALGANDDYPSYLDEIDSVREIYTEEFAIAGRVLDVGGHQGRLRCYLSDDVSLYVSVDPHIGVFRGVDAQPNLLRAYPSLREPCNFLACHAEMLPFAARSFDWVHMRSVLDHFSDPYLALVEAYRALRPGRALLVGLTAIGGRSSFQSEPAHSTPPRYTITAVAKAIRQNPKLILRIPRALLRRLAGVQPPPAAVEDDHMFHWRYDDLVDLLKTTGFTITKEHWQKPPFTMCVYISARKAGEKRYV